MKKALLISIPLLLCCCFSNATELMHWQRLPLPVELHIGHERVLFINKNVRVGYPAELNGKLRIQSSAGTVYLLASESFSDSRLQLRDVESGELILLDIHATDGEALEPVRLTYDSIYRNDSGNDTDISSESATIEYDIPAPVILTRHAAQMLYAPLRTVEPVAGIQRAPIRLPPTITTLLPTESVTAAPISAWKLGDNTVTAVKLKNRSRLRIDLDPRSLQGAFIAATFQHHWLGASGTPEDTTVVYLITHGSADNAILPEPPPVQNKEAKK